MITITESAQEYLAELLSKQDDVLGVRVFINQPGTPRAETCIAYCRKDDVQEEDEVKELKHFKVWYEERSLPFLEDALVDYSKDRMGGQLTIKAPNAKMPRVDAIGGSSAGVYVDNRPMVASLFRGIPKDQFDHILR